MVNFINHLCEFHFNDFFEFIYRHQAGDFGRIYQFPRLFGLTPHTHSQCGKFHKMQMLPSPGKGSLTHSRNCLSTGYVQAMKMQSCPAPTKSATWSGCQAQEFLLDTGPPAGSHEAVASTGRSHRMCPVDGHSASSGSERARCGTGRGDGNRDRQTFMRLLPGTRDSGLGQGRNSALGKVVWFRKEQGCGPKSPGDCLDGSTHRSCLGWAPGRQHCSPMGNTLALH